MTESLIPAATLLPQPWDQPELDYAVATLYAVVVGSATNSKPSQRKGTKLCVASTK